MKPDHQRGREVVDLVVRRELERTLNASLERRRTEKNETKDQTVVSGSTAPSSRKNLAQPPALDSM